MISAASSAGAGCPSRNPCPLFAAHLDQALQLRFGFDAFGDHRLVERAPQHEYRAHDLLPLSSASRRAIRSDRS
jgi:hypothetical protein